MSVDRIADVIVKKTREVEKLGAQLRELSAITHAEIHNGLNRISFRKWDTNNPIFKTEELLRECIDLGRNAVIESKKAMLCSLLDDMARVCSTTDLKEPMPDDATH